MIRPGICYIDCSMKKFLRAMSSRFMSFAVLVVIVGSLCFSAGEGLRLTPFRVSSLTENSENDRSQYGPLDVPAQLQKRSKRQALDLAAPASGETRKTVTAFSYRSEYETVETCSVLFLHRPEGRAPPSIS